MASACALFGKTGSSWVRFGGKKISQKNYNRSGKVSCSYSSSVMDPYKTLRIHRGASEVEVRKAFRQLALQVCFSVLFGIFTLSITFILLLGLSSTF